MKKRVMKKTRWKYAGLLLPILACLLLESERKAVLNKSTMLEKETVINGREEARGRPKPSQIQTDEEPLIKEKAESSPGDLPMKEESEAETKKKSKGTAEIQDSLKLQGASGIQEPVVPKELPESSEPQESSEPLEASTTKESSVSQEASESGESTISPESEAHVPTEDQTEETCEEAGHNWGAEMDVFGDGTMFRKECSVCGAWEKRTAIFADPVEYWWLQWTDEEGNIQRREFDTYEECRAAEDEVSGSWNFGNDYREELIGWEVISSEGDRYVTE